MLDSTSSTDVLCYIMLICLVFHLYQSQNIQKNQKLDPEVVAGQEMEAKSSYEDDTNIIENQSDLQEINNDVVQNDLTWGHKTLKKFLSSLRLL